jgi:predicted phage tail protein
MQCKIAGLSLFTDGNEFKILAVDPNTYKFLIKKCAEDEVAAENKVKLEVSSELQNESVPEEFSKDKVKDEVLEGLEKAEVKAEKEEDEKHKVGAGSAELNSEQSPDGVMSAVAVGKAKIKQESAAKGDRGSEYISSVRNINLLLSVLCNLEIY